MQTNVRPSLATISGVYRRQGRGGPGCRTHGRPTPLTGSYPGGRDAHRRHEQGRLGLSIDRSPRDGSLCQRTAYALVSRMLDDIGAQGWYRIVARRHGRRWLGTSVDGRRRLCLALTIHHGCCVCPSEVMRTYGCIGLDRTGQSAYLCL